MLPGVKIFLDTDDLEQLVLLEDYIQQSQCILAFLSRGYFKSRPCRTELATATLHRKRIVTVHEAHPSRGGMPIGMLHADFDQFTAPNAPAPRLDAALADIIFDETHIIEWQRQRDFQTLSLLMIAKPLLQSTPFYITEPVDLYVPDAIERAKLAFGAHSVVYYSSQNPGAESLAREIAEHLAAPQSVSTERGAISRNSSSSLRRMLNRADTARLDFSVLSTLVGVDRRMTVPESSVQVANMRQQKEDRASKILSNHFVTGVLPPLHPIGATGVPTKVVMLLYLNATTFTGADGEELARQVMDAQENGVEVVLVHEMDAEREGVEFDHFFTTTPEILIGSGLFNTLAIACHSKAYRPISLALVAKALGAALATEGTIARRLEQQMVSMTRSSFPVGSLPAAHRLQGLPRRASGGSGWNSSKIAIPSQNDTSDCEPRLDGAKRGCEERAAEDESLDPRLNPDMVAAPAQVSLECGTSPTYEVGYETPQLAGTQAAGASPSLSRGRSRLECRPIPPSR